MREYHKIPTAWKRDPENKNRTLIEGKWATPELAFLADCDWSWTEKVDGTNIRVMWDCEKVTFSGKTDASQVAATLFAVLQDMFPPALFKSLDLAPLCLYGEGFGAKIGKAGALYRNDQGFVLFDVNIGGWWLEQHNVDDIAGRLKIPQVPCRGVGKLGKAVDVVRGDGLLSMWGDFPVEGLVMRPNGAELHDRGGHRIITKIKRKDFPS